MLNNSVTQEADGRMAQESCELRALADTIGADVILCVLSSVGDCVCDRSMQA